MIQFENAVKRYKELILDDLHDIDVTCWVAGGAVRDYFMGVPIKTDHDLFFPSQKDYDDAFQFFKLKSGAEVIWESENGAKIRYDKRTFDLVKKFFKDPQETIDEFDFTVSMLAVDRERVYHGVTTFIDLSKKQLMINKITYPLSTLSRAFRYHNKGFKICLGEMRKLAIAVQEAEPISEVNEEQVNGRSMRPVSLGQLFAGID